eukprot:scaffold14040_cov74-Cyclotella_meneghiniana.AAC.5
MIFGKCTDIKRRPSLPGSLVTGGIVVVGLGSLATIGTLPQKTIHLLHLLLQELGVHLLIALLYSAFKP